MQDQGLGSWPKRRERIAPNDVAIIWGTNEITYGGLAARTRRLASALTRLSVGRGDRVAYLGSNHPALAETLFASTSLGAVFVPLNTRLSPRELAALVRDAEARILVHDPSLDEIAADISRETSLETIIRVGPDPREGARALEDLIAEADPADEIDRAVELSDEAMIMYTSGTTGSPKGVVLTHSNLTWNCFNALIDMDVRTDEVTLVNAPMFHTAALNQSFLPTFIKGGTSVLMPEFDAERTLALIAKHGVTLTFGVPAMFSALIEADAWTTADLSSLRAVFAGGAPVPADLIRRYQDRGVVFMQGYGMTEASPGVLFLRARDSLRKAGSAGTPCFFTDVRLIAPDGRPAAPGEPGEIQVRGPNVMSGYWRKPAETSLVLSEDGWFSSGDILTVDEEGCYTVTDRKKDMFITGGENVYPAEVEKALHEHPAVIDCAVIGVDDARWGEVGHAFVVLRDEASLTLDEMHSFLKDRLASYKVPRTVEHREALPRNASGKLLKAELKSSIRRDIA